MPILFELKFRVVPGVTTVGSYRTFIQDLRVRLGVRFSHNHPVLAIQPQPPNPPTQFFEVVFSTNSHSVRVRFRADNLYLIGYQMETTGQWWELDNKDEEGKLLPHLITEPGTDWLGFGGDYLGLTRAASSGPLTNYRVTAYTLESAINQLASSTDGRMRASSLITMIVMICESSRLIPIYTYITTYYNNPDTRLGFIQSWMMTLFNNWGNLSEFVLRADAFPDVDFQLGDDNSIDLPEISTTITTIAQVLEILGIMLGLCYSTKRPLTASCCGEGMCYMGSSILQVFSVCINNIDGEDPGQLYGTITIDGGLYKQNIYDRKKDNYESIKPGQYATLTGPLHPFAALGHFTMNLFLLDHDSISADDVIINETIYWEPFTMANVYDKLISHQLSSAKGSVTLNYAVMENAVIARVSIILGEGGEKWCEVYGHASLAYNYGNNDDATTCTLFQRTSSDYVEVERYDVIPLLRSILAVPLGNNSPKLTVSFYDHDSVSGDDQIAQGDIVLSPPDDIPGTTSQNIQGEDGNYVNINTDWRFAL